MQRPVIDATGLSGVYNISIFWDLDEGNGGAIAIPGAPV